MKTPLCCTALLVLTMGLAPVQDPAPTAAPAPDRPADRAALSKLLDQLVAAYNAGDAARLAAQFTPDGQVRTIEETTSDGQTRVEEGEIITGRDAIAKTFTAAFAENPGQTIAVQPKQLRFVGADTALEHGIATVTSADGSLTETSRYSVVYVRQNGQWLQAEVRDEPLSPQQLTADERLEELAWMHGEWISESDSANVDLVCQPSANGKFLDRKFEVRIEGVVALSGTQRIGWDPQRQQFRLWIFDDEGGFGDGLISRAGDQWVFKTNGVRSDGLSVSATSIVTPLGPDRVAWQTTDRTVAGEALPVFEEVILVRKPPAPPATTAP